MTCGSHSDLPALDPYYDGTLSDPTVAPPARKVSQGVSELGADFPTIDRYADHPRVQPALPG